MNTKIKLLIVLIATIVFACDSSSGLNRSNDSTIENGKIITLKYANGITKARISMKDSLRSGTVEFFYPNGQLKHKSIWENGKQKKLVQEFNEDGSSILRHIVFKGDSVGIVDSSYTGVISINTENTMFDAFFMCRIDRSDSLNFIQTKQAPKFPEERCETCKYQLKTLNGESIFRFTVGKEKSYKIGLVVTIPLEEDVVQTCDTIIDIKTKSI